MIGQARTIQIRNFINTHISMLFHIIPIFENMLLFISYQFTQLTSFLTTCNPFCREFTICTYFSSSDFVSTNPIFVYTIIRQANYLISYRRNIGIHIPSKATFINDVSPDFRLKTIVTQRSLISYNIRKSGISRQCLFRQQIFCITAVIIQNKR